MNVPVGEVPPDLTVRIERAESQASGRLLLQLLAAGYRVRTTVRRLRRSSRRRSSVNSVL